MSLEEGTKRRRAELETERVWRLKLAQQLETELSTLERITGTRRDKTLDVGIATAQGCSVLKPVGLL